VGGGWRRSLRPQGAAAVAVVRRLRNYSHALLHIVDADSEDVDIITGGGATIAWAAHSWVRARLAVLLS
jgi:hypothetical protein